MHWCPSSPCSFPGDAFVLSRFLRLWSQNYQGLDALDPAPCYQPLLDRAPTSHRMSDNVNFFIQASGSPKSIPAGPSPVNVNLRFTATQLRAMYQGVLDELDKTGGSNPGFSRTDLIIALLAYSFTQADEDSPPVDNLIMTFNVSTSPVNFSC
jgi:hypothetical protein